jgi:acetyl esterase/lipase
MHRRIPRLIVPLIAVLLFSKALWAAEPQAVNVWPAKAPGESRLQKPETSETKGNIARTTNVSTPTLTIYPAPKDNNTGAAVIICPGGGYSILAWDLEGTEVAQWLNSVGVTGIILKYRVPEKRPKDDVNHFPPLEDAQRAISLARSKAKDWEFDANRLGILGFSAGGHLTVLACTQYDHRCYEPIDDVDNVSCRPDFGIPIYPAWLEVEGKDELKPEFPLTKQTPPMFIACAADDKISAVGSAVLYLALKHAGVPAELHIYARGGHGFGLRRTDNPCSTWPQRCEAWLKSQGLLSIK